MSKRSDKLILPGSDATPRCCRVAIGGQAVIVSVASNALYPIRTLALDMPVTARRLVATTAEWVETRIRIAAGANIQPVSVFISFEATAAGKIAALGVGRSNETLTLITSAAPS